MPTFTIDTENNITVSASSKEIQGKAVFAGISARLYKTCTRTGPMRPASIGIADELGLHPPQACASEICQFCRGANIRLRFKLAGTRLLSARNH
jgi:hypothetical protein